MKWTKELPKTSGYYWILTMFSGVPSKSVVYVSISENRFWSLNSAYCGKDPGSPLITERLILWSDKPIDVPEDCFPGWKISDRKIKNHPEVNIYEEEL